MLSYHTTDQQLHWLSQSIAKANRTYLATKEDDSHTNLYFDVLGNRIVGRWITTPNGRILFTLNLDRQQFEIISNAQVVVAAIPTVSLPMREVAHEIERVLPQLGLDPAGFSAKLHFDIPRYAFVEQPIERLDPAGVAAWKSYRQLANEACRLLLGYAQVEGEIRIWPHHFDTGIFFKAKAGLGVGFGLAMKDEMAGAPYFYLTAYPDNGAMQYVNLPEGKSWRWELSDDWKGAILPLNELDDKSRSEKMSLLSDYLLKVFHWMVGQ